MAGFTSSALKRKEIDVAGAVPQRHPVRAAGAVFVALASVLFLYVCARNPNFGWPTVRAYLLEPSVLDGIKVTLALTAVSMTIGTVLGLFCALMKMSGLRFFTMFADAYLWFFRSTPLLVQLLFWYNLAALFPEIGIPGIGFVDTNDVITPLSAAVIGLALNEGAYMGEIIRAGLESVDPAQRETAEAFGMSRRDILMRILLPQAMRAIIPPFGNQVISMIKATAMVSVIAMNDLLFSVQTIYNQNFQIIPLLLVAVIWYLAITSVLTLIQMRIEKRLKRSDREAGLDEPAPSPLAAAEG